MMTHFSHDTIMDLMEVCFALFMQHAFMSHHFAHRSLSFIYLLVFQELGSSTFAHQNFLGKFPCLEMHSMLHAKLRDVTST